MELPNRQQLENGLARRLERLNTRQRRKLAALLGNPPKWENLPESFWNEMERETESETLVAFYLLFIASADYHADLDGGLDASTRQTLHERATEYSRQRARQFADAYTRGAQNAVDRMRGVFVRKGLTFKIDQEELDSEIAKALGPDRAAQAATNETTAAQSAGGEAGISATVGISQDDLWINRPELSRTGPCPTCKPLHMTPRSYWGRLFPEGPGREIHDGCVCTILYKRTGAYSDGLNAGAA